MMRVTVKTGLGVILAASMLSSCGAQSEFEPSAKGENLARATLIGAGSKEYGQVMVGEGDGGLIVKIRAEGLPPGPHGVHIHETGKCEGPDFKSAGGHWNPGNAEHGLDNPKGAHKGDFVNLDVGADGKGSLESLVQGAVMKGDNNALLDADGAAFVIHEGPDDLKTDPSGDSGGRIACGVFEGY